MDKRPESLMTLFISNAISKLGKKKAFPHQLNNTDRG